jgi:hypothetical protein
MADDRVEVVFGADFSELVSAAQQVKDQLGSLAGSVRGVGQDFAAAGEDMKSAADNGSSAWTTGFNFIESTADTVLKGVLLGTQTWQQSMARIFSDLAVSFAESVANMMMQWLALEALGIGAGASGGAGGIVGAGGSGLLGMLGLGGGLAGGGLLGGLFGGAAAGGGAVSAAGDLGALAMFQAGAWSIPQDMVALVHAGEMILPAGVAEMARAGGSVAPFPSAGAGGIAAGGGAGMTLNVSVQAIDAAGVAQWANANAKTLASTITRYMGSNPSTREG